MHSFRLMRIVGLQLTEDLTLAHSVSEPLPRSSLLRRQNCQNDKQKRR
jgi:hypothetical protein